jgi:F0F1-type ATP synthase epsilon subunit
VTYLIEIRGKDGHLGVLATHVPEFAAALKALLEHTGYETTTKTTSPTEGS